jgi:hypothetical protein
MEDPFKKTYKDVKSKREKFVSILVFGLFIFLFLFIFKPFGLGQLKQGQLFLVTLGFGLVTTFVLFIVKFLIEPVVSINNWTLGKSLIWNILITICIGVSNYFYMILIFDQVFVIKYFFYSIWTAILVGAIPVTISYITSFNKIYKTALEKAAVSPEEVLWENEVVIRAGNPKNEFRCNPKSIVYLCSNDNYVTIVTVKADVQSKTTIRGTLRSAESELRKCRRLLRCHKCYIVNLDFVERLTGHNQNMKIKLFPSGTEIPVSRLKADLVNKLTKK